MKRLMRRYLVEDFPVTPVSKPIRYERYYLRDDHRVQRRDEKIEEESFDPDDGVWRKRKITEEEFQEKTKNIEKKIIKDSYLIEFEPGATLMKYYGDHDGFMCLEVPFVTVDRMKLYHPPLWCGKEITDSFLALDSELVKHSKEEFLIELKKYQSKEGA